jgi:N-glycosylase/DNA lyase
MKDSAGNEDHTLPSTRMNELPEPWQRTYLSSRHAIQDRLRDFSHVRPEEYFYELIFCILTPQSSQHNAELTIGELQRDDFRTVGFDPTSYLRDPRHYIRFHITKSKRLLTIREIYPQIEILLLRKNPDIQNLRDEIINLVPGFGLKEASHFLRNIGYTGLAILDRHIFKHLVALKIIGKVPTSLTKKRYLNIEKRWLKFAREHEIPMEELDLLFWSMETGEIKK